MTKPRLRAILAYKFDNFMAKGGKSLFIVLTALFITSFTFLSLFRIGLEATGAESERGQGILRQIYLTFLQMTDPGNMAQDINSSPILKIATVLAGFTGLILLSMLIGFITTALVQKMEQLRKGHSTVIENGHSLILGWNPQRILEIIRELILANESEKDAAVVILADVGKEEMDDFINTALPNTQNTRIVTRSGSTSSLIKLRLVGAENCRSAIVLASATENASDYDKAISDAQTIKTILALSSARAKESELNIVAELYNIRNHEIVQSSCTHPISVVDANDILAKLMVQTSRSIGLSVAYGEILSFDGCEMYFHHDNWGGITFDEALYRFPDGVPMGIRTKDGEILINPSGNKILEKDDDILILADDDSTIDFQKKAVATPTAYPLKPGKISQILENELIIGYNKKVPCIIEQYADYVLDGSRVDIMLQDPSLEIREKINTLQQEHPNLKISIIESDPLDLESLKATQPCNRNNILILSSDDNSEKSDAKTILILLLLRKIVAEHDGDKVETRLITEVMDSENQNLISDVGVRDFIISNRFISMLLAQISEEPDIKKVYDDLFEEDGSEIYLKPISLYFEQIPDDLTFADCIAISRLRNEICLGIKTIDQEGDADKNYGIQLIPEKNKKFKLKPNDHLVVIAEDET